MAVALALLSAAMFGVGDFFGGIAARRVHPYVVGLVAHGLALVPLVAVSLAVPAPTLSGRDLLLVALGGGLGGIGLLFLFHGLAHGRMTVVAPVTAVVAAGLPVLAGLALGERPSPVQLFGVVAALGAIVLISQEAPADRAVAVGTEPGAPLLLLGDGLPVATVGETRGRRVLAAAVLAGTGFGVFYIALGKTSDDAGVWPLVAGRGTSLLLFCVLVARRSVLRSGVRRAGRCAGRVIAVSAALDVGANTAYLVAVRGGLLSIVPVLSSLYPAGTVLLARLVLREHLRPIQVAGLTLASVAVVLVAAG